MALGAGMVGMALLAIVLLLAVAFAGSLAWVWRDAERRGQPGFIVAVLVAFLFWPLSLLVWLAMRPKQSGESLRPGTGSLVAVIMLSLVGALVAVLLFVILRFGWTPNMVTGQTPFSKAVALAKRSEATAAVARIAAVYLHYREEHGRPPATLADLGLAPGQLPPHAQFELLPGTAATDIIVREDWGNHGGHGGAIAFGDGSVAWVDSPYKPLRMDVIKTAVEQQYRQQLGEEFIRVGAMTFNAQENRYDLEIFLNINGEFRRVLDLSQIGAREQERRGRDQQRLQQFLTRSARHAVRHDEAQDLSVYAGSLKLTRQHGTYHHACTVDELMERETLVANADDKKDIVDTAVGSGNFKTLVAALQAAGLGETLKGEGPFTVFAPTDEAFAKLPKGPAFDTVGELLKPENQGQLVEILKDHIVSGKVTLDKAFDAGELTTLQGSTIPAKFADGRVLIGPAGLLKADIATSNGVIHVIDQVLLPKMWGESSVPRFGPFPYRYGKLTSFRYAYCPAKEAEQQDSRKVGAAQSCNACHVLPAASFPDMWRNLRLGFDPKKQDAELANPNLFRWVKSGKHEDGKRSAMFGKTYAVMDLGQKGPPAPVIIKVGQEFDIELYTFINQEGARWYPGARPRISGEEAEGFNPKGPKNALPEITTESVVRVGEISQVPLSGKPGETYDVCYSDSKFGGPTAGAFFNPDEKFGTKTTCGKYLVRYRAVKAGTSEIRWQLYRQREDEKEVDAPGLDYFAEYILPVKVEEEQP